jgi:hypothetical protein
MCEYFTWKGILLTVLAITLSTLPAHAQSGQDPVTPARQGDPNPSSPPQQGQDGDVDHSVKTPMPVPPEMEIRPIGSSTPLPTYDTLLRWGPLYIRDAEFLQSYDRISDVPGPTPGVFNQGSFSSSILRTSIVYDRQLGQNRLTLQYSPRITVINGHVSGDFVNQTVAFDWIQQLSPRLTLGISNSFGYFSIRNLYGDYFLNLNTAPGTNVPSSFLDAGGTWLNTTTQATFAYALSPTSSVSVAPFFGYGRVTGQTNSPNGQDTFQYGSRFAWSKQLSPFRSVTAAYYYRIVRSLGTGVPYQGGEVGISQQLGAATVIGATVGALSEGYTTGTRWNLSGSVQASRGIGRTVVSIGYYRGFALFSELNSQGVAQRVDGSFRLNLSQRWYWTVHGGYEDSLSSSIANVSGKYVSTEFGYNLTPQISCFASYARKTQAGNFQNLLAGTRDYVLGGIRWTARPAN